ncbi:MAG: sugar ABC transporter permease, partial [Chloroflexota bacterium]|nr:sugar ABC transporter permease [Chloroflexota bacterium]
MQRETSMLMAQRAGSAGTTRTRATGVRRLLSAEWLLFLLFVGPNLILFAIFTYWPLIYSFYLSTVRWDMISPRKRDVGMDNYRYLWENDTFRTVLSNTAWFTVGAVGGTLILGLGAALLLDLKLRGRDEARAVVFMPTLLSGAAIGIGWVY